MHSQEANVFIPPCLTLLYVQCVAVGAEVSAGGAEHVFASMQPPAAGVTHAVCGVCRSDNIEHVSDW